MAAGSNRTGTDCSKRALAFADAKQDVQLRYQNVSTRTNTEYAASG